jgi:hypothetical protein
MRFLSSAVLPIIDFAIAQICDMRANQKNRAANGDNLFGHFLMDKDRSAQCAYACNSEITDSAGPLINKMGTNSAACSHSLLCNIPSIGACITAGNKASVIGTARQCTKHKQDSAMPKRSPMAVYKLIGLFTVDILLLRCFLHNISLHTIIIAITDKGKHLCR